MRLLVFFLLFFCAVIGQTNFPKDYFASPLNIPLQLSGNFGELRPNHFHAGFDFKTQKKEGLPVFASAEGYVSRIKISHGGYGKAIYITHPNGFTTVYGHLQSGFDRFENYIKKEQYKAKSYEIEVFPKPEELPVKKLEQIAWSGNTGGSDGPHLHFEIRDTKSEKIINPYFFGFDQQIPDTKKPVISGLFVYPLEKNCIVNQSEDYFSVNLSVLPNGNYVAQKLLTSGKIGFGIIANDYDDVSWNTNGVYLIKTSLNGKSFFKIQFDTFSFDESPAINAYIDYAVYKTQKLRIQKLFVHFPYVLSILNVDNASNGVINVKPNENYTLKIDVSDFFGNTSQISVPIQYLAQNIVHKEPESKPKYKLKAQRDNVFVKENVTVNIPANSFYYDFEFDFEVSKNRATIHRDVVPAKSSFSITMEDTISQEKDREKMFIALFDGKKYHHYHTKRNKNSFTIYTKTLGQYHLIKDTVAPTIFSVKSIEDKWLSKFKKLQFTISDDLSGIKTYEAYLNGKWILMEYESKLKLLTHNFDDGVVVEGKNDLKVIVTDNVGNSSIFETVFYRSQKP